MNPIVGVKSDSPFNYDIDKIDKALSSGTVTIPKGMNHADRIEYIRKYLEDLDEKNN